MMNWTGILLIEDQPTGDGRMIAAGALRWDNGPWPLTFDRAEGDHSAAVVGEVTRVWRDGALIRAEGRLQVDSDDHATATGARRVAELLTAPDGPAVGVSIEMDEQTVEMRMSKALYDRLTVAVDSDTRDADVAVVDGRVVVDTFRHDDQLQVTTDGRLRAVAVVHTPAFADAKIGIAAAGGNPADAFKNPDFGTDGDSDSRLVRQTPVRPDETPGWGCPLTVTDDGRVYGHLALRVRCHGAYSECVPPPDSGGDFSNFLVGEAVPGVPTGPIILNTTHGDLRAGAAAAHQHLANTGTAVADVTVGVDAHGTWVAGRLRPGVTEREIAALRGSTLSGEWHPVGGELRLIGVLAVNSPGYLVQRRGIAATFSVGASCCTPEDQTPEPGIVLVWGPPAAGKTTYVAERQLPGDLVIDFDLLAAALGASGHGDDDYLAATNTVRRALISHAYDVRAERRVWLVSANPEAPARYDHDEAVLIDPGRDTTLAQAVTAGRPDRWAAIINDWYDAHDGWVDRNDTRRRLAAALKTAGAKK